MFLSLYRETSLLFSFSFEHFSSHAQWCWKELVFKYTLISLLSELDGLLWNNTSLGSIYTFNSTSDYDSKKHPFGAAGTVEVKRFGGSSTIQILYDINNHVFLRRKVGEEAWNAWTQV